MKYWLEFNRLTKKYERQYAPKFNKALKAQIQSYIDTGYIDAVKSDEIYKLLTELYTKVGVSWAFQSGRYVRAKKARKPLGFSERIINLLQSQYGVEFLNMSEKITDTTKEQIKIILQEAQANGWGFDEIVKRLETPNLTLSRAMLIARTEVIGAANSGAMVNAMDLGATTKVWISAIDSRTRADHVKLDGQRVGFNEYFTVEDKNGITRRMMQPGDKNGGPAQVCNCRCAVGFQ